MIEVVDLSLRAGVFRLEGLNFQVPAGCYAVLMGRTGSGKTTLLEGLCGLKPAVAGRVLLDGRDVTRLPAGQRGIGYVPQDGALFSTLTVREHFEFALRVRGWPSAERKRRVAEVARMVGAEHLLDRRPLGLSGGERQRVALGRALAFHPRILLLDEPLAALDDESRQVLIDLLKRVQRDTGITALHVTHNSHEAHALAEQRLDLADGRVRVVDSADGNGRG